jgi:anthranilate phosphoribosyltransferase
MPETTTEKNKLSEFLRRLTNKENLSFEEAEQLLLALTDNNVKPETRSALISGILVALEIKGVTADELAGLAGAMRKKVLTVKTRHRNFVDIVGTGGSSIKTFNVSTAAAFVIAGAGLPIAKHGNRSVTSLTGSADVLQKLGVKIDVTQEIAQAALDGAGISFLFAPKFHKSFAFVAHVRKHLGIQTVFNRLGPMSNPAAAPRQVIGVSNPSDIEPMANAIKKLGTHHTWIVHGTDGLDELTLSRETYIAEIIKDDVRFFQIEPEDFGLHRAPIENLRVKTPEQSAKIIMEVLSGKRKDEARHLVVINAAAALVVGGKAKDPMHAARMAEQSIDSGQAQNKLERLIQTTNKQ